jgi:hypothetical protein
MNQPHYLILVDEKYQNMYASKAYIVQEDIEIVSNTQVCLVLLKYSSSCCVHILDDVTEKYY